MEVTVALAVIELISNIMKVWILSQESLSPGLRTKMADIAAEDYLKFRSILDKAFDAILKESTK